MFVQFINIILGCAIGDSFIPNGPLIIHDNGDAGFVWPSRVPLYIGATIGSTIGYFIILQIIICEMRSAAVSVRGVSAADASMEVARPSTLPRKLLVSEPPERQKDLSAVVDRSASCSKAVRKSSDSYFIKNEKQSPPSPHDQHLYDCRSGETVSEGLWSSWNGHSPTNCRPPRLGCRVTLSPINSTMSVLERTNSLKSVERLEGTRISRRACVVKASKDEAGRYPRCFISGKAQRLHSNLASQQKFRCGWHPCNTPRQYKSTRLTSKVKQIENELRHISHAQVYIWKHVNRTHHRASHR